MRIQLYVRVDDIDLSESVRIDLELGIESLKENIVKHGLKNSITLVIDDKGKLQLDDGFRRVLVYKLLDREFIPAEVRVTFDHCF